MVVVNDIVIIDRSVDSFVVDLWGLSGLTYVDMTLTARIFNQSSRTQYIKAVIVSPTDGTYTFDNGTSEVQLGAINPFWYSDFKLILRRNSIPSAGQVDTVTIRFESYKDDTYSTLVDSVTKTYTIEFEDFSAPVNYVVDILDEFDDGSAPNWSGGTVTDRASVRAGGYSYVLDAGDSNVTKTAVKTFDVPSGSKVVVLFYYAIRLDSKSSYTDWMSIKDYQVKLNDNILYQVDGSFRYSKSDLFEGWFQQGFDITQYAGTLGAQFSISAYFADEYAADKELFIDRFIVAHKP